MVPNVNLLFHIADDHFGLAVSHMRERVFLTMVETVMISENKKIGI